MTSNRAKEKACSASVPAGEPLTIGNPAAPLAEVPNPEISAVCSTASMRTEFPLCVTDLPLAEEVKRLPRADGLGDVRQIAREDVDAGRVPPAPSVVCPYCKVYCEAAGTSAGFHHYDCPVAGCAFTQKVATKGLRNVLMRNQPAVAAPEPSPYDARPTGPFKQPDPPRSPHDARPRRADPLSDEPADEA